MKKNYTRIAVVLDSSGSMQSCLNDTIGGFNHFIETQKQVEGEATITLAQFNSYYNLKINIEPLSKATGLTSQNSGNYAPPHRQ